MSNVNTTSHWDTVWSEEISRGEDRPYPDLYPSVVRAIPKNTKVVDVGCGTGYLLSLAQEEKQCRVFGVDLSPEAIRHMKERRQIDGIAVSVPPIPIADKEYDVALCTEVFEHVTNDKELSAELARIVKPGGLVIATVPNDRWGPEENEEHQRTYNAESFKALFAPYSNDISVEVVSNYLMLIAKV